MLVQLQCAASFVGDGKICGKDSDGDGYPDMQLNCNDTHCTQVCVYAVMYACTYVSYTSYMDINFKYA